MTTPRPYHHGDLHAALIAAAEAELAAKGVEGFSLRQVAKRAGVSHAAPAHHFGDARGLLTALAAHGFRRFLAAQSLREGRAASDARSQLLAAGLGYVDFAFAHPALFRLMFSSTHPHFADPDLADASEAAYRHLSEQVAALGGDTADAAAVWSLAHGLADLLSAGRMPDLGGLPPDQRDRALVALMARVLPRPKG
ncbi:MAG: hypothetical protein RIT14_179 [Pseudomonadota bacterium]|jgi:AcrR family transcriptional regulator